MTPESRDKLLHAYNSLRDALRNVWHETEEKTLPTLKQALDKAEEKTSLLSELGREELQTLSDYLQRDIQDAARLLNKNSEELADWLGFDLEFAEQRLADWVAQVADPTRLELERLAEQAQILGEWHTGEITGSGILKCAECGEQLRLDKASHIPPCPKCHGTLFTKEYIQE